MDPTTLANRTAWEKAYQRQLHQFDAMLAEAATGATGHRLLGRISRLRQRRCRYCYDH